MAEAERRRREGDEDQPFDHAEVDPLQPVAREIEAAGGVAKEFNTIAVDDGIAMGHDGMLYSLPSRDIIADSVEYMVNAHCADAMVCISNCDKITPGMLMAAMRLNIPVIFVSGGPMEAGKTRLANPVTKVMEFKKLDLVDAMVIAADTNYSDADVAEGGNLFRLNCASCHGTTFKGAPLSAGKSAPSLNDATDMQIYTAMLTGPESMPIFSDNEITPDQKRAIVAYIQTLKSSADPGGAGIDRIGPVSEAIVIWVAGIGAVMIAILWIGAKTQ